MTPYTDKRPTKPGWYWFRPDNETISECRFEPDQPVLLIASTSGLINQWHYTVDQMGGYFSGPIPEPPKPEGAKT